MTNSALHAIEQLLASGKPEEVRRGLELVRQELATIGSGEVRPLFEMVSTLFYIDTFDRPDLAPLMEEAISLLVSFGTWVIPALISNLNAGDLKAQMAIAQALGRMGDDVIEPLLAEYQSSPDPAKRSFVLYALGKIKSPAIVKAASFAIESADSPDLELRDTATRAIGKFAESISPSDLSEEMRRGFIEKLQRALADSNPGIRAKAVRSLGKLARFGHLNSKEREKLKATLLLILGNDEQFEWDRAYIVRREAEEALHYV
ncbi:MAG: HEAT repeat domain-containing protein [Bacteroidota bacterium]